MKVEITGKTFNGYVILFDQLTLPQVELVEEARDTLPKTRKYKGKDDNGKVVDKVGYERTSLDKPRLPAILACVKEWSVTHIPERPTPDNFPMTPRAEANEMLGIIFLNIQKVYNGELEIPNE